MKKTKQPTINQSTLPAAALLSFLKESRSSPTWTEKDLAASLNLRSEELQQALAVLELEGYIARLPQRSTWRTTEQGETVSGGKSPPFTRASVDKAISALGDRLRSANEDGNNPYEITHAVAFGDFLKDRPRVQAAEIGIELHRRKQPDAGTQALASEHTLEKAFLKQLRGNSSLIQLRRYEPWMKQRSHRDLLISQRSS
jgi:hypothetical protein